MEALRALKRMVRSVGDDLTSRSRTSSGSIQLHSTFQLAGLDAKALWNSCLELQCTSSSRSNDDKPEIAIGFEIFDFSLDGSSSSRGNTLISGEDFLTSLTNEIEKEETRAINRLRQFGPAE